MKKIFSLLLVTAVLFGTLTSCFFIQDNPLENNGTTKIRIGTLSGPTGMGMAKMISDNGLDSDKYSFTVYGKPDAAQAAFTAGDIDALCFPTNNAANLYAKLNGNLYVAAINCLGSLYVVSGSGYEINNIQDLEGKTIYASVPNSTTGAIIDYILKENNVNATITFEFNGETLNDHDVLSAYMAKGDIDLAILPEPKATATILSNAELGLKISLNLSTEWEKVSDESEPLTMGCIVFNKSFVDNNKATVDAFLAEYKASIEYINDKNNLDNSAEMIYNAGILPKAAIAKKALLNLYGSIVYIDGAEMQTALEGFYKVIGLAKPDDNFYYGK